LALDLTLAGRAFLERGFLDPLHRFEHAALVALVFVNWHRKTETAARLLIR
jgi:hypothetical protein